MSQFDISVQSTCGKEGLHVVLHSCRFQAQLEIYALAQAELPGSQESQKDQTWHAFSFVLMHNRQSEPEGGPMTILNSLEDLVGVLRGNSPSAREGDTERTLNAAASYSDSLRQHLLSHPPSKPGSITRTKVELEHLSREFTRLKRELQRCEC